MAAGALPSPVLPHLRAESAFMAEAEAGRAVPVRQQTLVSGAEAEGVFLEITSPSFQRSLAEAGPMERQPGLPAQAAVMEPPEMNRWEEQAEAAAGPTVPARAAQAAMAAFAAAVAVAVGLEPVQAAQVEMEEMDALSSGFINLTAVIGHGRLYTDSRSPASDKFHPTSVPGLWPERHGRRKQCHFQPDPEVAGVHGEPNQ